MPEPADQDLISRAAAGDRTAFDELFRVYVDRVHRHLYSLVGPDADLDDLVQATFLRVYRSLRSFRRDSRFETWLHRVTVNVALSHLRGRKRRVLDIPLGGVELPATGGSPADEVTLKENVRLLHAILDRLNQKKRVVFVLYEVEGHTLEEIGKILEISSNTVSARLAAARREVQRAATKLRFRVGTPQRDDEARKVSGQCR